MTTDKAHIEVKIEVPNEHTDAVCNFIIENFSSGLLLEEEEGSALTGIIFYLLEKQSENFETKLTDYIKAIVESDSDYTVRIKQKVVADADWIEKYRQSIVPIHIGDDILVRPGWCEAEDGVNFDIVIEPKMAFGTGSHETTISSLSAIRKNVKRGDRFCDLGCGSGILSILADKMGVSFIKAIDYDVAAVENCRENFDTNNVTTENEIIFGSIEKALSDDPYDFVCANIIKSTILPNVAALVSITAVGGVLVFSGLLPEDEAEISEALLNEKQDSFTIDHFNSWLTYTIHRK